MIVGNGHVPEHEFTLVENTASARNGIRTVSYSEVANKDVVHLRTDMENAV
jgi:hypothetical protein